MKKLDLFGSQYSKPADSVLGIHLSVADTPSVSYRLLRSMPSLRAIRKDNYQDWLYSADEYPGACEAIASSLESDDLGGNPNRYAGILCETQTVLRSPDYFWRSEVGYRNNRLFEECGQFCFDDATMGAISSDILVPVDFLVVSFNKLIRKHTILRNSVRIATISMSTRAWSESVLPTLLFQFDGTSRTSIEVCDVNGEMEKCWVVLDTDVPVTYNRSRNTIR